MTAEALGTDSVRLTWTAVPGAQGYNVYRSLVSGGGYELIGATAGTTYADATVEAGSRYYSDGQDLLREWDFVHDADSGAAMPRMSPLPKVLSVSLMVFSIM